MTDKQPMFGLGDKVEKPFGYPFPGIVVARFGNSEGETRYVVESTTLPGLMHIFSPRQLKERHD